MPNLSYTHNEQRGEVIIISNGTFVAKYNITKNIFNFVSQPGAGPDSTNAYNLGIEGDKSFVKDVLSNYNELDAQKIIAYCLLKNHEKSCLDKVDMQKRFSDRGNYNWTIVGVTDVAPSGNCTYLARITSPNGTIINRNIALNKGLNEAEIDNAIILVVNKTIDNHYKAFLAADPTLSPAAANPSGDPTKISSINESSSNSGSWFGSFFKKSSTNHANNNSPFPTHKELGWFLENCNNSKRVNQTHLSIGDYSLSKPDNNTYSLHLSNSSAVINITKTELEDVCTNNNETSYKQLLLLI